MPQETGPRRKHKYARLYAHFGDGDMFALAVSENLPRMRKKNVDANARGPIPVIAGSSEAYGALTEARERAIADAAKEVEQAKRDYLAQVAHVREKERVLEAMAGPGGRFADTLGPQFASLQQQVADANAKLAALEAARDDLAIELEAVSATTILEPEALASLDPLETKLSVLGHGAAGSGELATEPGSKRTFTLRAVARTFKALGLSPDFVSVKLPSCESADLRERTAFESDPPASRGRFVKVRAPAQILADEMRRAGFAEARVTGYQGIGWMTPPGRTALQQAGPVFNEETARRRSEVAKVFTPRPKQLLPCL